MNAFTLLLTAMVLWSGPAFAQADKVHACTIPNTMTADFNTFCATLREQDKPLEWDDDACATSFMRTGMRDFGIVTQLRDQKERANDEQRDAGRAFEDRFPVEASLECGDTIVTTDYDPPEQCDPPDGVVCDESCQLIVESP